MSREAEVDMMMEAIAALPTLAPDAQRTYMVRARCRARLERPTAGEWIAAMVSVAVSASGAVYVWYLARAALSLAR